MRLLVLVPLMFSDPVLMPPTHGPGTPLAFPSRSCCCDPSPRGAISVEQCQALQFLGEQAAREIQAVSI